MKGKVLVLVLILMVSFLGPGRGSERDFVNSAHEYTIPRRGVQDFDDGEIVMVDNPLEVSMEGDYYTVQGKHYTCALRSVLSEDLLTVSVGDAVITYDLPGNQPFGVLNATEAVCEEKGKCYGHGRKSLLYKSISEGIDLRYTFLERKVLEEVVLDKFRNIRIMQKVTTENVWISQKEGGIYFHHVKTGRLAFFIPPPVMYEENDSTNKCYNIHYEVKKTGNQYMIEKVIDKKGLDWLKDPQRQYPVIVDSTTEPGISDPWEESGLLPYGQYFENMNEYVSPTNGSLTVSQTDLYLPGRGLDLVIARVYTTPQLFTLDDTYPEDFLPTEEDQPWMIANGWRYDLPGITDNYLYLWGGRMYKLEWDSDPPECPGMFCFPPLEPEELVFNNHKGNHFRLIKHTDETYTLYLKDGRVCEFSDTGDIESITDVYGNQITFSGDIIIDTVGRVVTVSGSGVNYGQRSVNYNVQYVENSEGEYEPLLYSVTDCLGRVTQYSYEYVYHDIYGDHPNRFLLTKVVYPTGGQTVYTYGKKERRTCKDDACHNWEDDCHEVADCYNTFYQFKVITQEMYTDPNTLVKIRTFTYVDDWEDTLKSTEKTKDELSYIQSEIHFTINEGKIKTRTVKDHTGTQVEKVVYNYNSQGESILSQYFKGNTDEVNYQEFSSYDSWGNQIYYRNSLGYESYASYYNSSSENMFTAYSGESVPLFSNQFYSNTITDTVHNKVSSSCTIEGGDTVESYYLYDSSGNMTESKDIFNGRSYTVYYGLFDENGQVKFPFTSDTVSDDAILRIAGLPTLNPVQRSETHFTSEHPGYNNTGYWQGSTYYVYWLYGSGGDVQDGYDPVGPFVHYPGTPGYQNYESWVSGVVQYVKTNYVTSENISPVACSYMLNNGSWIQITPDLKNGTAQISIPKEGILLSNTLEFSESSSYTTRFQWALFVPVQAEPETYYKNFAYDSYGNLVSATNDYGTVLFEYSPVHQSAYLTAVTDPLGNTLSCTYDTVGNIISITDARGYTYQYEYDLLNRLRKKINPDLTEREAVYDDVDNMVTIYDELDHYTVKYFDGLGRITEVNYAGLCIEEYTYNYLNKVETRKDPLGSVYTYEYDSMGRIEKSHNPDSTYSQWIYNNLENTVTIFDENSHKTEYQYDWAGNLLSVKEFIDQTSYLTEYTYDEMGNVIRMKDAEGNATSYKYGLFGLVSITYPNGTTEHLVYDSIGNVIEKTTGARTIYYHYNSASQLIEVEYPDSSVTYTYDANGNRISMEDPVSSSACVYDLRNRLLSETKVIDNEEYTTSYSYDLASNVVSMTYPDGTVVNQNYDLLNRITSVEGFSDFTWNGNSQIEEVTYTNGVTTNYAYDLQGRPTQINTTKNGSDLLNLNYTYDPVGNILQMTNSPNNHVTEQWDCTYDALNRLLTAAGGPQGDSYSLNYSYDKTGNRTQLNNTVYTYNNMNELLSVDSEGLGNPSGQLPWWDSQYQYRKEITFGGNHDLIPDGCTCTFSMDTTAAALASGDDVRIVYKTDTDMVELDRIGDAWNSTNTMISFKIQSEIPANAERGPGTYFVYYNNPQAGLPPANPSNVYIFYDDFNRPNFMVVGNSWIEDEQNLGIGILRIYNGQLRIEEHQNEYAHAEQVLSEDFVEVTCRIKPDTNSGDAWAPSVDLFWNDSNNGNHIQILTLGDGRLGCKVVKDGTVDFQLFSGVITVNQYNWVRIRLTSDTVYFDYGGTGTDPVWVNKHTVSRPTQVSGSFSKLILGKGAEQVLYTNPDLDNNYITPGNSGIQFIDDVTVKRYIENPPEISLGTEETEGLEGEPETHYTFVYDEYGNCITKSDGLNTWEYHYNYRNMLVSVEENSQATEQYIYDGDGQRIKKIDSESTRIYINSGISILYEINMTTQMEAVYIYGPAGRIAKKVNDITEFYHTDHLGSTRLTTSETGSTVTELQYKPFGEQINASEEEYTYNGKELDLTGLYYFIARYYDPEIGRFITRDPLQGKRELPQTLNRYAYCLNNPLVYTDPTGTSTGAQRRIENLFARLQGVNPDELAEIQEMIDAGDLVTALKRILDLLGFGYEEKDGTLTVEIGDKTYTMAIDNNLKDESGKDAFGHVVGSTIFINFSSGKVGDVTLTVLHEVSHVVLGCKDEDKEHSYIYSIEYSYMVALEKLGVEFSAGGEDTVWPNFKANVEAKSLKHDRYGKYRIDLVEVLKILTRGWKRC